MYKRAWAAGAIFFLLSVSMTLGAAARKAPGPNFRKSIAKNDRVLQALNRLTFGPGSGDIEKVNRTGLKNWIDLQLNPERIPENPALDAQLAPLSSLNMTSEEIARVYPTPQVIAAVATGKMPLPEDPALKALYTQLAERYKARIQKKTGATDATATDDEPQFRLDDILTPDQIRTVRTGKPVDKVALLSSLPPAKLDDVILALPQGVRRGLFALAPVELRRKLLMSFAPQQVVAHDLLEAKLYRAVYSNRQLEEVLDDFWFNHFNVFLDKGADRYLVTDYERNAIRPHVLGKFQDLLLATAESPAMMFYLDNWESVDPNADAARRKKNPKAKVRGLNENYGRELLELHTLGVDGGYTQQDIIEVARCFTGWTIQGPRQGGGFWFNDKVHDHGEKHVLGVTIPAGGGQNDGLKVLDIVAHHPSTARFISRELAQRFVADNPPASLIEAMAKTFHDSDGDIRKVLKTMFDSKEFWSEGAYRAKVKSPFEMVASALRATGADVNYAFGLTEKIGQLGEPLYRKLEPTGYSNSGEEWMNSASLLGRMNFALALTQNQLPGVKVETGRFGSSDASGVAQAMLFRPISPETRTAIERGIADRKQPASPELVGGLLLGSPEFQRR